MPNFVMLVGVPTSGKSTYAKQLKEAAPESDYQIVSRDHYVLLAGKTIPTHVLSSMFETQEVPTSDEGFEILGTIKQ